MFRLLFRLFKGITVIVSVLIQAIILGTLLAFLQLELLVVNEVDSILGPIIDKYIDKSKSLSDKFKEWGE